ncbi:uncharacterized protein N7469_006302, partial [Penicillium citrinum]
HVGTKIIVHPAPAPASEASESTTASRNQQALYGIVVLVDKYGLPTGVLNVEEITGYRTTMSAMIPYFWSEYTENIIKTITIVNRSSERAQELIETVYDNNQAYWTSSCQLESLITTEDDFQSRLKMLLAQADAIFCTVSSRVPLFPLEYLKLDKRGGKYPFISAVGSWQPDMIEVDPAIIHYVTQTPGFNSTGGLTGTVIVDDEKHALIHAGEIVQTDLTKDQILSIGEVLSWKREGSLGSEPTDGLNKWTSERLIVYKSIGVMCYGSCRCKRNFGFGSQEGFGYIDLGLLNNYSTSRDIE